MFCLRHLTILTGLFVVIAMIVLLGYKYEKPTIEYKERGEVFEYPPEGYGQYSFLKQRIQTLSSGPSILAVANEATIWQSIDMPLSVCFDDDGSSASKSTRRRVRDIVQKWTSEDSSVAFNMNSFMTPDSCGDGLYDIRISFEGNSVWSLHGKESILYEHRNRPSMFLGGFHQRPPTDKEFERLVLHEFGHALGLYHEHQNSNQSCTAEYNWNLLEPLLKGEPYNFDDKKIQANFHKLNFIDPINTDFDSESIMLYTFDSIFYRNKEDSVCFHEKNYEISIIDRSFISKKFPFVSSSDKDFLDFQKDTNPSEEIKEAKDKVRITKIYDRVSKMTQASTISESDERLILEYVKKFDSSTL